MQFETGINAEKRLKITNTLDFRNETWNGICYVSFDVQFQAFTIMSELISGLEDANVLMMSQLLENLIQNKSNAHCRPLRNH